MKIKLVILILVAIGILLSVNKGLIPTGKITESYVEETSIPPEVYFCPEEDCQSQLLKLIDASNESIHCAFYDIDLNDLLNALENKNVDVRLIVDEQNIQGLDDINYVTNENTNQLTHNKFCVFDGKIITSGSFNPTERGNHFNNNNLIIIHSTYLSSNYESEFEELWNKRFGSGDRVEYPIIHFNGKKIENYFCPEDSCSENIISELESAENSIFLMTFTFTHQGIADALIANHNSGIDVKGVIEKFQSSRWGQFNKLKDNGIDVKWDGNSYMMHNKVFIIDNQTVITGSFNPTKAADEKNDENILIIHDENVAEEYLKEFDKIFGETNEG